MDIVLEEVSVEEAQRCLPEIIGIARRQREPVYIARDGVRVAAIIDEPVLERVVSRLEDYIAIETIEQHRAEDDGYYTTMAEMQAEEDAHVLAIARSGLRRREAK